MSTSCRQRIGVRDVLSVQNNLLQPLLIIILLTHLSPGAAFAFRPENAFSFHPSDLTLTHSVCVPKHGETNSHT